MNAAFLLVATAWFAGADAPPAGPEKINPPAPAPATVAAPVDGSCSSCGGECDTCGSKHHGWKAKFRAMFSKKGSCGCDTCGAPACNTCAAPAPAPAPACSSCGAPACDTCGGHGHGRKFGGLFSKHHKSESCDTCSTCDSCGAAAPAPALMEKIEPKGDSGDPAKKMPIGLTPLKPISMQIAPNVIILETEKARF